MLQESQIQKRHQRETDESQIEHRRVMHWQTIQSLIHINQEIMPEREHIGKGLESRRKCHNRK